MDKKQMIRTFAERGILLSPDVASKINEDNMNTVLGIAKQSGDVVLKDMRETALTINVRKTKKMKKLGVQEFVKYYNNKYSNLRDIISKKIKPVSINNTKQTYSDVSVIGIIKEFIPKGFILEDPTGEIGVVNIGTGSQTTTTPLSVDDVVGVTGYVKEDKLFVKDVILPDIPLNNKPKRIDINIIFSTALTDGVKSSAQDTNFVLIPELSENPNPERIISGLNNPAWITVTRGNVKTDILVYRPDEETNPQQAINWLKKRHLCPRKEAILSSDDPFMIKTIPGVFWIVQEKNWNENYKGVNIVSCGKGGGYFAKLNLWSMETKFYSPEKQ
jgi:DNA polymerase II small subunit/DNA polymerase delta subunit B